jgi:SAM-dependent methyltransferase
MDLSRETGRYDAAVLCNMLHVVENPRKVLMETRTLLKPSGRIILATYCHGEASRIQDRIFSLGMRLLHRRGSNPSCISLWIPGCIYPTADAGSLWRSHRFLRGRFPCAFIVARAWLAGTPALRVIAVNL